MSMRNPWTTEGKAVIESDTTIVELTGRAWVVRLPDHNVNFTLGTSSTPDREAYVIEIFDETGTVDMVYIPRHDTTTHLSRIWVEREKDRLYVREYTIRREHKVRDHEIEFWRTLLRGAFKAEEKKAKTDVE